MLLGYLSNSAASWLLSSDRERISPRLLYSKFWVKLSHCINPRQCSWFALDTIRRIITASAFTVVSWNKGIPSPSAYWAKNLSSCRNEGLQKNDFASCLPFVSPSGTARPDTTRKYRLFKAWEHCVYFQKRNLAKNIASVYFWKSNPSKNNFHVHFWKTNQKINIGWL